MNKPNNTITSIDDPTYFYRNVLNSRPKSSKFVDITNDADIWNVYINSKSEATRNDALNELLGRHISFIIQIAKQHHSKNTGVAELSDFYGYAIEYALEAINSYDPTRNVQLNTWMGKIINCLLSSTVDDITLIKCPSHKRGLRSYFGGKYESNEEYKKAIEKKYGLDDQKTLDKCRQQNEVLVAGIISYDDYITNEDGDIVEREIKSVFDVAPSNAEVILSSIEWHDAIKSLTEEEKQIFELFFKSRYTKKEIMQQTGYEIAVISKYVKNIRKKLKANFSQ